MRLLGRPPAGAGGGGGERARSGTAARRRGRRREAPEDEGADASISDGIDDGVGNRPNKRGGSEGEGRRGRRAGPKTKGKRERLSSALRLLGANVRCDWGHLELASKQLAAAGGGAEPEESRGRGEQTAGPSRRRQKGPSRKSFFPGSLLVEGLYNRIGGAIAHFGDDETKRDARGNAPGRTNGGLPSITFWAKKRRGEGSGMLIRSQGRRRGARRAGEGPRWSARGQDGWRGAKRGD